MKNNQGQQTEAVKQALICHIRDQNLRQGDRLPSQVELRKQLGVGAVTIQRAIASLEQAGIVEIMPHKGVIVKHIDTNGFIGREIGLVCPWRTHQPSSASLLQCTQLQLHKAACQCKLFLRNFPEMTDVDSLSYFDGLKRCIEQKQIQGLLTTVSFDKEAWAFFRKSGLPVVSLETASQNGGFKVVTANIIERSFLLARERGFMRPALFYGGYPWTEETRRIFAANCALSPDIYCHFMDPEMVMADMPINWEPMITKALDEYAAMPNDRKPDVLIIPDDFITVIVSQYLLRLRLNGLRWTPHIIYRASRQIPVIPKGFISGDRFETDIMKYAETSVTLLLDVIRGREREERSIVVEPMLYRMETE